MKLITYNPFYPTRWTNLFNDVDYVTSPSVNVVEKENGFALDVVSPGLAKEDFKIELKDKVLTISAEKKSETKNESEKVWRNEYSFASFKRTFHLPDVVDGDGIQANYENGILKLFIPKKPEVVPAVKTIEVA